MTREIIFNNTLVNDASKCFVIAEIGNNHQGSLENAKKLVVAAQKSGASAVKFQKRNNKEIFTNEMFTSSYVGPQSFAATYGEHRDKLELSDDDFNKLFDFSKKQGITFFATPFDLRSADFLNDLGVPCFKVASGDLTNIPLIEKIAKFNKPMIISTGASDFWEVENTVKCATELNSQIILMQCTSIYPAKPATINLNVIRTYRKKFSNIVIGYSGHDAGITIPVAAYALGARFIEKHFTLDRTQKGTDHQFSLTPELMKYLVDELESVRLSLGDGNKVLLSEEKLARYKMGKKIVAKRKIKEGTYISLEDLEFKSPGDGIPPNQLESVLGKKITREYFKEETLELKDLED
ncbi:MAG: N-acetylneuraminate synthase [Actinobacteria bacterium]|nr:N-acetylneuraminate synthase [Actinomycetota bacterium]